MIVTVLPEPGAKNTDSAWRTEIGIHIATRTHKHYPQRNPKICLHNRFRASTNIKQRRGVGAIKQGLCLGRAIERARDLVIERTTNPRNTYPSQHDLGGQKI